MDGDEVYNEQGIYVPYPGRMGRGREMGRGPYEKSGILHETSLPPLQTKHETFEIQIDGADALRTERVERK